jgi:hypothetical protein
LSNELIEYAARDAFASVKVTTAVDTAKYVYRTPGRDDLEAGTPVRLLARHTNRIVAVANFHHVEEKSKFVRARNGKLSERSFKRNMVKLVRVFDKAVFTQSTVGGEGAQSLGNIDVNEPLEWWISRMQLTTEEELDTAVRNELAAQQRRDATNAGDVAIETPPVAIETPAAVDAADMGTETATANTASEATATTHATAAVTTATTTHATAAAPAASTETETNTATNGGAGYGTRRYELVDIDWDDNDLELPDGTRFEDYPEAHVRDGSLDNVSDFVLVDLTAHDHDHGGKGLQQLFDRNHVKRDVFHVLKDY